MTDGDNPDVEPGTTLPVPPSCDGRSSASDEGDRNANWEEVHEGADLFALGDSPDDPAKGVSVEKHNLLDDRDSANDDKRSEQVGPETTSPLHHAASGHERSLTESESKILDSIVNQAMLGATLNDGLELPWEKGIMACIFGDEPLAAVPKVPTLSHNMDDRLPDREQMLGNNLDPPAKRQRVCNSTLRMYERAIRFRNNLTDHEADEAKWNRAIEKLYAVILSSPGVVPDGVRFQEGHMDINFRQLRTLCGSRSPNTVAKRVNFFCQAKCSP